MALNTNTSTVFAKFTGQEIMSEMGRLLFAVLNTFALGGYQIQLFRNIDLDQLDEERPYLQTIKTIDNLTLVDEIPNNTESMIYLFDKKDKDCTNKQWKNTVQIGIDAFSSHLYSSINGIHSVMMPYPMHPLNYGPTLPDRLNAARANERKSKIFFSGDTQGYKRNRVQYPAPKLTRTQVIDTILERSSDLTIQIDDEASFKELLQQNHVNKCVIVNNSNFRIDADSWLESISTGDFFLCPPGYVMPMCHNVIEAMAVGTIPILNYPEWLSPSLEDGVNCIAFTDADDLTDKIESVLSMKQSEINDMKDRVIEYYEQHLDPATFINKLLALDKSNYLILMITDACIAKNPNKLNKNSILITGEARTPHDIWNGIRNIFKN